MSSRLDAQTPADRARAAASAARALGRSPELARSRAVVLYAALPDELPTQPFLALVEGSGLPALFPRTTSAGGLEMVVCSGWEELSPGRYGVPEPPADRPGRGLAPGDLVLIPGLAFDRSGYRLGRGGGYWDRTIPSTRSEALVLVGVGYAWQRVESVPRGPHDRRVDVLLTDAGLERLEAS